MNAPVTTGPRTVQTAVAKIPLRQVKNVREMLMNDQAKDQLSAVAASHMKPERMMRLIANALRTTPKLAECSHMSLLGAMMQCAGLGLEPNTVLGHAYLIPFDKKAYNQQTKRWEVVGTDVQLIIGYKGLIDLARRSGHITSISANIHYSDDELWEYEEGTEATLRHRPGPQDGEKLHAYAIAKFKDGGHAYVVLPWSHVMKIRDGSQGWQAAVKTATKYKKPVNSPWATHENEMAKKTAIRALAKFLPLSTEFRDAVEVDGGRANFADFAMNPTEGLDVEQAEYIDGEYSPGEEEGQGDDDQPQDEGNSPETENKPEPKPVKKAEKAPDHTDKTPQEERPQRQTKANKADDEEQKSMFGGFSASEMIQKISDQIIDNLTDGADLEGTLEMFEVQLAEIQKAEPDEYEAMMDEFKAFVAQRDGEGEQ